MTDITYKNSDQRRRARRRERWAAGNGEREVVDVISKVLPPNFSPSSKSMRRVEKALKPINFIRRVRRPQMG
ncbi:MULTISPECIES: hypothetical protein [Serratia]|uniref:Uncharacterized protein n=1 Tax=Serratia ureilytica TaxID=300181 RepID=A0A9X9G0J3_9GAMM|nr:MULTISPECIES: hypothetical protein [Serratia]TXE22196.1 hypothetical protein FOT63_25790 [Serratia ureilytica]